MAMKRSLNILAMCEQRYRKALACVCWGFLVALSLNPMDKDIWGYGDKGGGVADGSGEREQAAVGVGGMGDLLIWVLETDWRKVSRNATKGLTSPTQESNYTKA
ncbi:hypothetical protein BaRGS_00010049 [Batillaria attramentaria]|uniref:Uncharacterized protein n=1 Tax=Batillaria attramentaria TaxID=370345 RepID=A0ABD0LI11_9CAEN